MKEKDFDWCNDSGYSDVFDNSLCECTAPQVNDGMCICGRPINNTMMNNKKRTTKQVIAEQQAINRKLWAKENGRLHHVDANKLIAEFMGEDVSKIQQDTWGCKQNELQYHTSWDWLMAVISKCLKVGGDISVERIYHSLHTQDLSFAYESVVEFIKEYNNED